MIVFSLYINIDKFSDDSRKNSIIEYMKKTEKNNIFIYN